MEIKNLAYLRTLKSSDFPDLGSKLAEALQSIASQATNVEQQVNGNPSGQPQAPPAINGVKVTGQNGHFNVAIQDPNTIYRGVQYFVEHADNPQFTNSHIVHMGDSRNANLFLGNTTRYFRAYSSYSSSPPSAAAYHGSAAAPLAVKGGGTVGPPAFQPSESSGTGTPGQALTGPGPVPFRSPNGKPPVR